MPVSMRRLKGQGAGFLGDVGEAKKVSGYDLFPGRGMRISIKTRDWGRGSGGVRPAFGSI